MDELKKFSQAILSGITGATNAPGIAGVSDANNRAFASRMRSPIIDKAFGVGTAAGAVADEEEKRRQAAEQANIQRLKDQVDPSKYVKLRKEDGGFKFLDPDGNEIGIDRYSARTGQRPVDILKDSDNPIDLQYVNDYETMNQVMKASFQGDFNTVNSVLDKSGLSRDYKPENFMQLLIKKYPHIYGVGKYEDTRKSLNNPVFKLPQDDEEDEDLY